MVVVYKYDIHTECLVGIIIMLDAGRTEWQEAVRMAKIRKRRNKPCCEGSMGKLR